MVKFSILGLGGVIHVFWGRIFVENVINDPRTLFERRNRTKIGNRKNAEILVNSVKSGLLGHLKTAEISRF